LGALLFAASILYSFFFPSVEVDISFNMDSGPSTAALIQKHVADFPVLLPLTFVVKHFLVQRSLNEVYTGGAALHFSN
jgi:DNA polymerase sigma